MKQVMIEIVNPKMEEMGIEQETQYAPLRFRDDKFMGYFYSVDNTQITFYVGSESFICKNCKKNIDIFESLL